MIAPARALRKFATRIGQFGAHGCTAVELDATGHTMIARVKACGVAGVRRFSPHALRRAAVVALYRAGTDVSVAASVAGHSPAIALKHYREVAESETASAIKAARLGYFDGTSGDGKVRQFPRSRP